jgi:hypothetical protein
MITKIYFSIFVFFLTFPCAVCQTAYHDAIKLSEMLAVSPGTTDFKFPLKDSILYSEILIKYTNNNTSLTLKQIEQEYKDNIYIFKFLPNIGTLAADKGLFSINGTAKSLISSVGGLDVTTFADGLARFLVERSKEEISVTFFDRFKEKLNDYPELTKLFPTTAAFLNLIETYNYASMLQVLKESYEKDINDLSGNLRGLRELTESNCDKCKETNKAECISRINAIVGFFNKEESLYFVASTILIDNLIKGSNTAQIVNAIALDSQVTKFSDFNTANAFKLINLFSESLRSQDGDNIWVSSKDISDKLLSNTNAFTIYLGLLYQKSKSLDIKFDSLRFHDKLGSLVNKTSQIKTYLQELINNTENLNSEIKEIKEKKKDKTGFTTEDYHRYFNSIIDFLEDALKVQPTFNINISTQVAAYLKTTRSAGAIYYSIKNRDFGSVVFNTVIILDNTLPSNVKFKGELIKYGSFVASVAQADNPDEVKNAIEAAALPSGSSRIKRETYSNVSLNAYLGLFAGRERLFEIKETEKQTNFTFGPFAPVGVAWSWGIKPKSKSPTHGGKSFSLFVSLIDVGAVAALRLNDDNTDALPEIQLKNIIAPGLFGVFGFGRSPFSLGAGMQLGPTLRKIEPNVPQQNNDNYYLRYSVFFAVDIPLLNFYTKPR